MLTTYINNDEATNKQFASADARKRNAANKHLHTQKTKDQLVRMQLALELCYNYKAYYFIFGKQRVGIKLDKAIKKERRMLEQLEADWTLRDVRKRVSKQGVIYYFVAHS